MACVCVFRRPGRVDALLDRAAAAITDAMQYKHIVDEVMAQYKKTH